MYIQWLRDRIGRIDHIGRTAVLDQDTHPAPHVAEYTAGANVFPRAGQPPLSRQVILVATLMWLATRLVFIAITFIPTNHLGISPAHLQNAPHDRLFLWSQFDANWYLHIAQHGYDSRAATAFFPLYPLLTRMLTFIIGSDHSLLAALIVSNLGALIAFIGLGLLAAHDARRDAAAFPAIRALAAYPFAFFLFAPYTDGLFLGFAVVAFLCARRGAWKWAALYAFLAGATRATGVILIPALFWEFGRQQGWWQRASWQADRWRVLLRELLRAKPLSDFVLALGAVPLAIGLFMLYCGKTVGSPLAPFEAQGHYWGRTGMPVWATLARAVGDLFAAPAGSGVQAMILIDLGAIVLFTAMTLATIRSAPVAYTIYMAGLLYLSSAMPILRHPSILDAAARFMLAAFPVWLVAGRWMEKRPWLDMLVVSLGFSLQTVCALLFMSGFLVQ